MEHRFISYSQSWSEPPIQMTQYHHCGTAPMESKPKGNSVLRSCYGCFTCPACGMPLVMRNIWRALFPKRLYRHTRGDFRLSKRLITIGFNLSGKLLWGWLCILWLTAMLQSLSTSDKPLLLPLLEYTAIRVSNAHASMTSLQALPIGLYDPLSRLGSK